MCSWGEYFKDSPIGIVLSVPCQHFIFITSFFKGLRGGGVMELLNEQRDQFFWTTLAALLMIYLVHVPESESKAQTESESANSLSEEEKLLMQKLGWTVFNRKVIAQLGRKICCLKRERQNLFCHWESCIIFRFVVGGIYICIYIYMTICYIGHFTFLCPSNFSKCSKTIGIHISLSEKMFFRRLNGSFGVQCIKCHLQQFWLSPQEMCNFLPF